MNKDFQVEKKISKAFVFGVPAVTLIFAVNSNDPFNVPKQIILLFIMGILLIPLISFYKEKKLKKSEIGFQITLIVLSFLFFQLVALLFNQNLFISFFGETSRRNGFVTYLGFCIVSLYAMFTLKNKILIVIKMQLITTIPILIYSIFQIRGKDFVTWDNPYNSAISTLGNPNFTSAFLSLSFMSAFGLLLLNQIQLQFKLVAVFVCLLSLFVIVKSESRQGIYAIIIAVLFYINLRSYLFQNKKRILIYLITVSVSILSTLGMLQIGPLASYLYKNSVSVRGYYWRAAVEMFLSNPYKGVGLDQYGLYFRKFKEIEYVRTYGTEITSTDAHNTFLQMFATGGVGVGITYLGIVFLTYFFSIRMLKESTDRNQKNTTLVLLSVFTAYLAQSFISISNLGLSIWGWVLIGALLANSRIDNLRTTEKNLAFSPNYKKYKQDLLNPFLYFLVLVPILLISIPMYRSEYNMFILRGLANPNYPDNREQVIKLSESIFSNPFADPYLKLRATLHLGDMGLHGEGMTEIKKLNSSSRNNYEVLWVLALYQVQFENYSAAVNTRLEIAKIDPYNSKNYLALMQLYKQINERDLMNEIYEKIKSIDSNSPDMAAAQELVK